MKQLLKFTLTVFVIFLLAFSIKAQTTITGRLIDFDSNSAICDAGIYLVDTQYNYIKIFDRTDTSGYFSLQIDTSVNNALLIFKHHPFFATEIQNLNLTATGTYDLGDICMVKMVVKYDVPWCGTEYKILKKELQAANNPFKKLYDGTITSQNR